MPRDVFVPVDRRRRDGRRARCGSRSTACSSPARMRPARRSRAAAGRRMIKVQLELGGKDPIYVCDDVDVKAAAAARRRRRVLQHGPVVLLGRAHLRARVDPRRVRRARSSPRSRATRSAIRWTRRPTSARSRAGRSSTCCKRQVADAKKKGAKLLTGGSVVKRKGNWFEPTVFADVDHSMALMRDESFGPIIGIQAVADDDAAVDLMNDTEYGLTAGVYTQRRRRARADSRAASHAGTRLLELLRSREPAAAVVGRRAIRASGSRCRPTASRRSRGRRRGTCAACRRPRPPARACRRERSCLDPRRALTSPADSGQDQGYHQFADQRSWLGRAARSQTCYRTLRLRFVGRRRRAAPPLTPARALRRAQPRPACGSSRWASSVRRSDRRGITKIRPMRRSSGIACR